MRPISKFIADAQREVNNYVRLRDHGMPCISCQRHHHGQLHAGHYRSTAAAPELRFNLHNIYLQCAPCNTHLAGNLILYRASLVKRFGARFVEWLEGPHEHPRWTREYLTRLKSVMARKSARLRKRRML